MRGDDPKSEKELEPLPCGSWLWDVDAHELTLSPGVFRLLSLDPERDAASFDVTRCLRHPRDRARVEHEFRQLRETGSAVFRYRVIRRDGVVRHVRQVADTLDGLAEGRPRKIVGTLQDVTVECPAMSELFTELALRKALDEWQTADQGVDRLLERLGTAMDCTAGALWRIEGDVLACRSFWSAPDSKILGFEQDTRRLRLEPGRGLPGLAWQRAQPVAVADVAEFSGFRRLVSARRSGLAGAVAFPAPFGGDVLAVLEFYTDERREFTPRLVGTLNEIGREIGRSITHQQTGGSGTPIRLTARELEVLEIAASGRNGPEIARTLHVSPETIKTHFDHIYKKLGVSERSGAVAEAMRLGWIK